MHIRPIKPGGNAASRERGFPNPLVKRVSPAWPARLLQLKGRTGKPALPVLAVLVGLATSAALAAGPPAAAIRIAGAPETVFDSSKDGCTGIDTPDLNARAFRDADGAIVFFGLHFVNRALRGPDLSHLKIDCQIVLDSADNPDPAKFDGHNYIAATWTEDGRHIDAIVHQEYHADQYGTCTAKGDLACWYNSLLAYRSDDGGHGFVKSTPSVVAVAPFRQEVEQGRHRGFFAPSNVVSEGKYRYFFGATTGWSGQDSGDCLFRSINPSDSASWRAFDGRDFTVRFPNPYASAAAPRPAPCKTFAPFAFPIGAVVRQRGSGLWIAVFQASRKDPDLPVDGFYYATGKSLTDWSLPRLLVAGPTLYNGPCGSQTSLLGYPSLLDETAKTRNFEDAGTSPFLYFAEIGTKDCNFTGTRKLVRVKLEIAPGR